MHVPQVLVEDFHMAMGDETPEEYTPINWNAVKRRRNLMREELSELEDALYENNPLEIIDAICDLLYVTYGTAVELGVDVEPFFEAIHAANIKKMGGPIRADGKRLKPAGWKPANLEEIFVKLYGYSPL